MSDPDLKACPHCGPGRSVVSLYQTDMGRWAVACGKCGSHCGHCKTEDEARELWDSRPAEGDAALELVRLTRELRIAERGRARMQDHWNEARAERDQYKAHSTAWYAAAGKALDQVKKQAAELAALRERAERAEAEAGGIRGAAEHLLRLWDTYQADEGSVSPHDYLRCADFDALRTSLAITAARPAPEPTP